MSTPLVLGRVKSGALSPTSSAEETWDVPSRPKSKPETRKLRWRVVNLNICRFPFSYESFCTLRSAIPFAVPGESSNHSRSFIQRLRDDLDPQCRCNFEVNDELDVVVYFDWNLARTCPFENLVHQTRRLATRLVEVRTVTSKTALFRVPTAKKHCGNPLSRRNLQSKTRNVEGKRPWHHDAMNLIFPDTVECRLRFFLSNDRFLDQHDF